MNKYLKIALSMIPFILVCLITVELIYQAAKDTIEEEKQRVQGNQLASVFVLSESQRLKKIQLQRDSYKQLPLLPSLKIAEKSDAWLICEQNNKRGIILSITTNQGYSGDIDLLMGIDDSFKIVGLRVLNHQETPGLGDKIEREKSDWIDQFIAHPIDSSSWELNFAYEVNGENDAFDAITAATITSKAVKNVVYQTLMQVSMDSRIMNSCE